MASPAEQSQAIQLLESAQSTAVKVTQNRYSDPTLSIEAQKILQYLVRTYAPEDKISEEEIELAVGIGGISLSDALYDLEEAQLIRPMGPHASLARHSNFLLNISAWSRVGANVVGFDAEKDMVAVATAVNKYDRIDRDALILETDLPERRVDIAVLLLKDGDQIGILRPLDRSVIFASAFSFA